MTVLYKLSQGQLSRQYHYDFGLRALKAVLVMAGELKRGSPKLKGGATPETNEIVTNICSCHNFFSLSSVQIIFIPACCLLCVL